MIKYDDIKRHPENTCQMYTKGGILRRRDTTGSESYWKEGKLGLI